MSRAFAISLKRPHEQLGLPMPMVRRLANVERGTWMALIIGGVMACIGMYVYQVNAAASKSFELRELEQQVERLKDTVGALDYKVTERTSIHALQGNVVGMGYIPLTQVRYLEAAKTPVAKIGVPLPP